MNKIDNQTDNNKSIVTHNPKKGDARHAGVSRIIQRKYFHLMAFIMFVPGLAFFPRFLYLSFGVALAIFFLGSFLSFLLFSLFLFDFSFLFFSLFSPSLSSPFLS